MRAGFLIALVFLFFMPLCSFAQTGVRGEASDNPGNIPIITGPVTPCVNQSGNVYITEPFMTNYIWIVSDAEITAGGGAFDNSITITWLSEGTKTVLVTYTGSSGPGVLDVVVQPNSPVSITITPSINPVCPGTLVTFTAVVINGGVTPSYNWFVNGASVGGNSPVYSYIPVNNDIVHCQVLSSLVCPPGNQVSSAPVIMIVSANFPVGVTVSASANPSCQGTPVTFTASPFNGGNSPSYQWKLGVSNILGATNSAYTFVPVNGNVIRCVMTSSLTCTSGNPATSSPLTMTVSTNQPVGISITPSENPVCEGNQVTFTATPTNGGSAPFYSWMINGALSGLNASTMTYSPQNTDVVTCILNSNALCKTGNPATSNTIPVVVFPYAPVSISITASANPLCNGSLVTLTAIPVNGGTTPQFQWKINGIDAGTNSPVYSYLPANGDQVICILNSDLSCATANPATSNTITLTVGPPLVPGVSILASSNPACAGTPVQFTANPENGGSNPLFQWVRNTVNVPGATNSTFTYIPNNNDLVYCSMTSNAICSMGAVVSSSAILMSVSPSLPVSVTITVPQTTVCQGTNVVFTAVAVNGGSAFYQWKVNGFNAGANNAILSYIPADNDVITCEVTSSLSCAVGSPALSNPITMNVESSIDVSVSISASSNPACENEVVTFTASCINGGLTPVYAWKVDGFNVGTNSPVYSDIMTSGWVVTCEVTSSYTCKVNDPAISNPIAMNITPKLPVCVFISNSNNPSCLGTPVTYSAATTGGGLTPVYQWKVNGTPAGTPSTTFTFVPANNDVITCQLTSSIQCPITNPVSSNSITQAVNPFLAPSITITASATTVCTGTPVTFTSSITNGGIAAYQWRLNGVLVGINQSFILLQPKDGDQVTCELTSSLMCVNSAQVSSNTIILTVSSALPAGISISVPPSSNPFCQGSNVTFSSVPINGGNSPGYQWLINGLPPTLPAGTNSTYTYAPQDGDFVTCRITSDLWCATPKPATSNPVYMLQNNGTPVSVTIVASANPVCDGGSATFTALQINGGTSPSYQWKKNGLNVGTNSSTYTYSPVSSGDIITCVLTSNAACKSGSPATSNPITMITSAGLPASISIATVTNPFCQGTSVKFTATAVNGGNSPVYQWRVNGSPVGPNGTILNYSPLNNDVVTCEVTSNATCFNGTNPVVSLPITMISSTLLPVGITITASENSVCQGTAVRYTATPVNGGETPEYQWKVNGINNGPAKTDPVFVYTPGNADVVKCDVNSSLICASGNPATSNAIVMTVNPPVAAGVTIAASANPVCLGTQVTITATPVNPGTLPVYKWRVNGIIKQSGNSPVYILTPVNGDVVTVTMTSNSTDCLTGNPAVSNSIPIVVNTEQPVSVSIQAFDNPFCVGSQVRFEATPSNGGTTPSYQWKKNGANIDGATTSIYIYTPLVNDQITCEVTSNQSCIVGNPALSNIIIMTPTLSTVQVTANITVNNNNICPNTSQVIFSATVINGGSVPFYQWQRNGVNTGNNSATYTMSSPLNNEQVVCYVTSNLDCADPKTVSSNIITMVVYPPAPVSVSVVASNNSICKGTSVIYTATPVNPGTSPLYRWYVNGFLKTELNNGPVTSYIPEDNDQVKCRIVSNAPCNTGNNTYSNIINMIVFPYSTVGVSIAAGSNPVCQGAMVTFTATSVNGGSSPVYQWKVNGLAVGTGSSTYSYVPVNGDIVSCVIVSNAACVLNSTATSNQVTMIVSPLLPVSVYIAPSSNPVCQGTVTFNATPANGGSSPFYQWKVNNSNAGTNNPVFNYAPSDNDQVTCVLTSSQVCKTGDPATSNTVTLAVIPSLPVSVGIAPAVLPLPACQGTTVTYLATAINGGATPSYQWMVNGFFVGTGSSSFSYVPNNGDVIKCQLHSSVSCPDGNPAISNAITMNFSPVLSPGISIASSANPSCSGTMVNYSTTVTNGGVNPVFQWYIGGSAVTGATNAAYAYTPVNNDQVYSRLTSDIPCPSTNPVNSNSIAMSVLPQQNSSVSISTLSNTVCAGIPIKFTATAINPGPTPAFQWKVSGSNMGIGSTSFTYIPTDLDEVTCELTSSVSCITNNPVISNAITMTVRSEFPVSITIDASENPSCVSEPVTFTANTVNGGVDPVYRWMVDGYQVGDNSPTYTYTPTPGHVITCEVKSGYECEPVPALSNAILMVVNNIQQVEVSIVSSSNPACSGSVVTYTSTPTNGGSNPAYEWIVNDFDYPGATNATFAYIPSDADVVRCNMTSNENCITGNPAQSESITMTISSSFPADVTVVASGNPVCVFTPVTFTATPVFGGPAPSYQWRVNSINIFGATTTTYTYYPVNNDVVECVMTSALTLCTANPVTSVPIIMEVLDIPVSVTISADPVTAVCAGTPVNFAALPVNGGSIPSYQWKVNGLNSSGATNVTYTYAPLNNDEVICLLMSNALCSSGSLAVSNSLFTVVNPLEPVSLSIAVSDNPVCAGEPVMCIATPVNGGTTPGFQWKVNNIDVAGATDVTYSFTPANNDEIICILTSDATCPTGNPATSNMITLMVNPLEPLSISIDASDNTVCAGTSLTFSATTANGGAIPAYQWKVNNIDVSGATDDTYSFVPANNDEITCVLTSSATCPAGNPATSNILTMTVNPVLPVSISIVATATEVCAGTSVTYTATPVNGGNAPLYQWYLNGSSVSGATNATYSYVPINNDLITCVLTSNEACPTGNPATSNTVSMIVGPLYSVSISIVASATEVCAGTSVTLTATPTNGGTSPLYQWLVNGALVPGATNATYSYLPVNNDIITCILTSNDACSTGSPAISNTLIMTVNPLLPISVSIAATATVVCAGTSVTYTATPVNGGTSSVYAWQVNGTPAPGATSATYTYQPVNNDFVTCILTSNETCSTGSPAISNAVNMTVNPVLPVSISIAATATEVCAGTTVTCTATPVNGGNAPLYQWYLSGSSVSGATNATYSYVPVNNDLITCVLTSNEICPTGNPATSNTVTMTVNPLYQVSITIVASATEVCAGTSVTYTATPANGGTTPMYQWLVNGAIVPGATNTTYSYVPVSGDVITCTLTSNDVCSTGSPATSNTLIMTVNPLLPVGISIAATATEVCAGTSVTFNATSVNGGTSPGYEWKVNGTTAPGATNGSYTFVPVNNDVITCILTSGEMCPTGNPATSNAVTITVNPLQPVSVLVTASANPVCAGTLVIYTATPVNGGTAPVYQWKVNNLNIPGATNSNFLYTPSNNDLITCVLTSDAICPTGNPATGIPFVAVISSPVVSYSACHDVETVVYAKPFRLRGGLPLGGIYSGPGVIPGTNIFDPGAANIGGNTITYTYTTVENCISASFLTINNNPGTPVNCSNPTLTDMRDGRVYPIVQIGSQCWMAANLNHGSMKNSVDPQSDNCVNEKYCLGNIENNCTQFGGLYQWDELMRYDPSLDGHQGLCPPGWHVPNEAEWMTLFSFYGGQSQAGTFIKDPGPGSFKAQLGGALYQNQSTWSFYPPDFAATFFWTSEPAGLWKAKSHGLNSEVGSVSDYQSGRVNGFSVRCLSDQP
ncbi:MAG: FISUMP domain-containing protein [Bacteroidales bacterium]|nr:FISUMP domain-containing protein [Bacteroidales bacterium]